MYLVRGEVTRGQGLPELSTERPNILQLHTLARAFWKRQPNPGTTSHHVSMETFLSPWLPASFPVYIFFGPIINSSGVHMKSLVRELTPRVLSHTESLQEGVGETPSTANGKAVISGEARRDK